MGPLPGGGRARGLFKAIIAAPPFTGGPGRDLEGQALCTNMSVSMVTTRHLQGQKDGTRRDRTRDRVDCASAEAFN